MYSTCKYLYCCLIQLAGFPVVLVNHRGQEYQQCIVLRVVPVTQQMGQVLPTDLTVQLVSLMSPPVQGAT